MLFATIGDILTIRKHYQKTFKLNSDESANDNSLSCFDMNKLKELLGEYADEPITGEIMLSILEECLVEVEMSEADNFFMEINDPGGDGATNVGYSGKDKYDSYNHYEPESLEDERDMPDPKTTVPKQQKKPAETEYTRTRQTTTGRKAQVV